jgi:hypothetical protein
MQKLKKKDWILSEAKLDKKKGAEMYENVQDHIHENLNDKNDLSDLIKVKE